MHAFERKAPEFLVKCEPNWVQAVDKYMNWSDKYITGGHKHIDWADKYNQFLE